MEIIITKGSLVGDELFAFGMVRVVRDEKTAQNRRFASVVASTAQMRGSGLDVISARNRIHFKDYKQ